ncbi:MAG: nitroreductase family protein [Candidatus Helarchaeota archaeon]
MKIIGVDFEKCIKCEECIKECPSKLFHKTETENQDGVKIKFIDEFNACIECGHCVSICPKDAILVKKEAGEGDFWEFEELGDISKIIELNTLMKFIRARRSIRRFQNKKIPTEKVKMILEAMRYAPSASNAQNWEYIIITNPEDIKYFSKQVIKLFYLLRKIMKFKFIIKYFIPHHQKVLLMDPKTKSQLNEIINDYENGIDRIFYDAPCIIVISSYKSGDLAANDAGIALTHGMLAAQSLGLGTCWIGFAQEAVKRNNKLKNWLKIGKNKKCLGVMIVGYPAMKFLKAPIRKPLKIKWL